MATMRRFDANSIGFWFIGALCGVLLMVGITALRQQHHETTSSMVFVTSSSEMAAPVGGRLGGIDSSDTANDAIVKASVSRVRGPGEGLNQFVDNSSLAVGAGRITGPGEGLNPVTQ